MEAADIIDKMQEYDNADLFWDSTDEDEFKWEFYALNMLEGLEYEEWRGNGETLVEAYKDAESERRVSEMEV